MRSRLLEIVEGVFINENGGLRSNVACPSAVCGITSGEMCARINDHVSRNVTYPNHKAE